MRKRLLVILLVILSFNLHSQEIYDNFYKFKAELYNTALEKMEASIAEYREKTEKMQISEEEKLTLENFLILEEVNILNRDNSNKKKIFSKLKAQNDKSAVFMQGKKNSQAGKWFLLSWGDIKSQYISFLAGQDMYKEAYDTKLLYLDALKQDKKFAPASISYGLWMFFAPPIAGGGYENSLKEFSKAVSNAKNNYEKYLALIFRSQVYFALENEASSKKDLKAAAGLIADENFSLVIEELNKNDQIFFSK